MNNSIRLLFPNLDFNYAYPQREASLAHHLNILRRDFDIESVTKLSGHGCLVPHIRLKPSPNHNAHSLRELFAHLQLE